MSNFDFAFTWVHVINILNNFKHGIGRNSNLCHKIADEIKAFEID